MDARRVARAGGWAAVVAGITGAASAVLLLAIPPAVSPDVFNHPLSPTAFVVVQVIFGLHHLLTACALWAFWRAGLAGPGRFSRAAGWSAVVTMGLLGVWEFVALAGNGAPYPSSQTEWIETGYGMLSLLCGVALILLGVATVRARVLTGVWRWVMLVIGVYVFVPLTPALFGGFVAGRVALGVWLLLFAMLGWGMLRWAAHPGRVAADVPGTSRHLVS